MVQSVKAIYRDGVLEPSESLDLEDGDVVMLSISVERHAENGEAVDASSGGNGVGDSASGSSESQKPTDVKALLETFRKIRESVPESEWEKLPRDGSINYKHYLYGHPKVDLE